MEWIKMDLSKVPEDIFIKVKTSNGKIGFAKLHVSYYANSDDYVEWMCPNWDVNIPGSIEFWSEEGEYDENSTKCEFECSEICKKDE